MENNIDLKSLWQQQPVPEPDINAVLGRIRKLKRGRLRTLVFLNIALLATCCFIAGIWVFFQPQLLSTKIGIILAISAMLIFLLAYNRMLPLYRKQNEPQKNSQYLEQLAEIKSRERFMQGRMINLYFLLLSAGLLLYLYEYTLNRPLAGVVIVYTLSCGWLAFNWFYLRPKQIRKQQKRINDLIAQLHEIRTQLQEADEDGK